MFSFNTIDMRDYGMLTVFVIGDGVGEKSSVWREFSHAKCSGRPDKMWGVRDIWKYDSPRGDGNSA